MHRKMRELLQKQKERMDNITIDTLDTPEKFCPMADEIVPVLVAILRDVTELIEQMTRRLKKLDESRPGGKYSSISHPDTLVLWQEYRDRYHALFDPHCTENFLRRRIDCCQSLGDTFFSALYAEDSKVSFLMKSKNKAVIIVYAALPQHNYRYTMCLEKDTWKIDKMEFQYTGDKKWNEDRYM